ncbi:MAG TPA: hypothetical protein PKE16_02365 [Hyphomicrobium sp.]|nr:hypothetical protein [Hyphomicrobium sp.]
MKRIALLLVLAAPLALAACSTIQNHDMPPPDIVNNPAPPQ